MLVVCSFQLNDLGHYAEALMTKGVLAPRGSDDQLEVSMGTFQPIRPKICDLGFVRYISRQTLKYELIETANLLSQLEI